MKDLALNFLTIPRVEYCAHKKEYMESIWNKKIKLLKVFTKASTGLLIIQNQRGLATISHLEAVYADQANAFLIAQSEGFQERLQNLQKDFVCIDAQCSDSKIVLMKTFETLTQFDFQKIIIVTYEDEANVKDILISLGNKN